MVEHAARRVMERPHLRLKLQPIKFDASMKRRLVKLRGRQRGLDSRRAVVRSRPPASRDDRNAPPSKQAFRRLLARPAWRADAHSDAPQVRDLNIPGDFTLLLSAALVRSPSSRTLSVRSVRCLGRRAAAFSALRGASCDNGFGSIHGRAELCVQGRPLRNGSCIHSIVAHRFAPQKVASLVPLTRWQYRTVVSVALDAGVCLLPIWSQIPERRHCAPPRLLLAVIAVCGRRHAGLGRRRHQRAPLANVS